jgi:hypothetical protein
MKWLNKLFLKVQQKIDTGEDNVSEQEINEVLDKISKRDIRFYYLAEAVQIRYKDQEICKYINPDIIKEKKQLRRQLLDFIHQLEDLYEATHSVK